MGILPFKQKPHVRGKSPDSPQASQTYGTGPKPVSQDRLHEIMDEMGLTTSEGTKPPADISKYREQRNPERG